MGLRDQRRAARRLLHSQQNHVVLPLAGQDVKSCRCASPGQKVSMMRTERGGGAGLGAQRTQGEGGHSGQADWSASPRRSLGIMVPAPDNSS